jgi:hypothetical protein
MSLRDTKFHGKTLLNQLAFRKLFDTQFRAARAYFKRREEYRRIAEKKIKKEYELENAELDLTELIKQYKARRFWQTDKKARNLSKIEEHAENLKEMRAEVAEQTAKWDEHLDEILEREKRIVEGMIDDFEKHESKIIIPGSKEQKFAEKIGDNLIGFDRHLHANLQKNGPLEEKIHDMDAGWEKYMRLLSLRRNSTRKATRNSSV